jgi:ParB family chromosome partitioning protein
MVISKKDMAARAARAGHMAPSIEDRLRQARDLVSSHPLDESAPRSSEGSTNDGAVLWLGSGRAAPSTPANGIYLAMVPLDQIDPNPFNARRIYRPTRVSELAASIGAHGQEVPGTGTRRGDRVVLAAGHYRLRALKVLGASTMALMIHEGLTDRDLYAFSYRENAEREGHSALDNAMAWRELLDQGVYASETEIAEVTGMSLSNVNKTMAALRLSAPVLDMVKEDPGAFALSVLYELALYEAAAGPAKALAMARLVGAGEAGRKEIQEARAQVESPKERKRKETSRQYRIVHEGQHIGSLKEWDSGRVALEVLLADPKERVALVSELRERFRLSEGNT